MKVYAGYIGRTANVGEGFYNLKKFSAHIKVAEISIRELEEDDAYYEEGYRIKIRIPSNYIGGTIGTEGLQSFVCKSFGEAENILKARPSRNKAILAAKEEGWHTDPNTAAADAVQKLLNKIESYNERPKGSCR